MSNNAITQSGAFNDPDITPDGATVPPGETPSADAATDTAQEDSRDDPGDLADDSDGDDDSTEDDGDGGQQGDAVSRARQQAAKYRTRLRDTEAERDQLRSDLDAQRRAVVEWFATNRTQQWDPVVAPELLNAAGLDVAELLSEDDGHLDMAKVRDFIDATATRFRVTRGFAPNPAQGAGGPVPAKTSLADAFRR